MRPRTMQGRAGVLTLRIVESVLHNYNGTFTGIVVRYLARRSLVGKYENAVVQSVKY